jgi:hypothetical protein
MQTFSFTPANFPPRENQKSAYPKLPTHLSLPSFDYRLTKSLIDYVFVDEHNRHKRLKGEIFLHDYKILPLLNIDSDARMRRLSTAQDQM